MPGGGEVIQKMNFAIYRRLPLAERKRWMIQAGREAREATRDEKADAKDLAA